MPLSPIPSREKPTQCFCFSHFLIPKVIEQNEFIWKLRNWFSFESYRLFYHIVVLYKMSYFGELNAGV